MSGGRDEAEEMGGSCCDHLADTYADLRQTIVSSNRCGNDARVFEMGVAMRAKEFNEIWNAAMSSTIDRVLEIIDKDIDFLQAVRKTRQPARGCDKRI